MIKINYALQVCDVASNQGLQRYCSDSKTEVTIKCVTSFLHSVEYAAKQNGENGNLENVTLNKIMTERNVLCCTPYESLALHMQHEYEKDPYINWKERWDSIPTL